MPKTWPTRFKKIMEDRDLSYTALANFLGISRQALYNYSSKTREPDIKTGYAIAKALNLRAEDVVTLFEPVFEEENY